MGMVGLRDVFVMAGPHHHHHHHLDPHLHHHHVIPLLAAAAADDPSAARPRSSGGPIQLWQQQQQQSQQPLHHGNPNPVGAAGSGSGSGSAAATCQDCGNQAKKDCTHRRCRTCCKSRGFDCSTHVKSTWVPAARRRERQLINAAPGSSGSTSGAKKPRLVVPSQTTATTSHTSTSNTTPPRSFDTSSSHQDAGFKEALPGQVRAPAVFKCVRVTAVDDGEDEYAYQAVVNIGGHVFKGFLYDQGLDSPASREAFPNISELHLGGGGRTNGGGPPSPIIDPSDVYASSAGGFLQGGTSYGNPIN